MKFAAVLALAASSFSMANAQGLAYGVEVVLGCPMTMMADCQAAPPAVDGMAGDVVEPLEKAVEAAIPEDRRHLLKQQRDLASVTVTDTELVQRQLGLFGTLTYASVGYAEQYVQCSTVGLGSGECFQIILTYEARVEPNGGVHEDNVDELTLGFVDPEWREVARQLLKQHVARMYADKVFTDVKIDDHIFISTFGDPHFKTFNGGWFDFMGACDLKMIHAPTFDGEKALDVDIRTKIRYDYSYVESAAIKLGDDVLEVGSYGEYYMNGVSSAKMPATLGGYTVTKESPSSKVTIFKIQISSTDSIVIKNFKDMVAVVFDGVSGSRLAGSVGMVGTKDMEGKMIGRDGQTEITDPNMFAAEWQIRDDEPMLFNSASGPQFPEACQLPEASAAKGRRLGETIALSAAEKACAKWAQHNYDACVHDVMAIGDLELAAAGAF